MKDALRFIFEIIELSTRMISNFLDYIEYSDDAVATTTCEHISRIGEIKREASSTEVLDLSTRLEHLLAIKHLHFVRSSTSSDDQITRIFLELCLVNHARFFGRKAFIPADVLDELG